MLLQQKKCKVQLIFGEITEYIFNLFIVLKAEQVAAMLDINGIYIELIESGESNIFGNFRKCFHINDQIVYRCDLKLL